jgi:hypothetical protein
MSDSQPGLDVDEMLKRFKERALAVKQRPLPPVAGDERKAFIDQAKQDYMDFAIVSDASWELTDGVLTLTVDLRSADGSGS